MEFSILGPVEAANGDAALPLGGPRQRALLACLLVHANRVVAADSLVDQLWVDPPRDAHAALQNQVSRLRKVVGDRLVTKAPGYVLRVEAGELDLDRFRALVAEAGSTVDLRERARLLREADALFRGVPFAQIDAPFAAAEAAGLEELRVAAVEARLDAELERGRHAELLPELAALVAQNPFRERLRGQHIVALYRSGRQAEALAAYRDTRQMLDEHLGLEPSPELRELERAILRHDPSLVRERVEEPAVAGDDAAPPASRPRRYVVAAAAAFAVLAAAGLGSAYLLQSGLQKPAAPAAQPSHRVAAPVNHKLPVHRPVVEKTTTLRPRATVVTPKHVTHVAARKPAPVVKHVPAAKPAAPATTTPAARTRTVPPAKPKRPPNVTPTVTTVPDAPAPAGSREQIDTFDSTAPNWAMWGSGMDAGTAYALQNGRLELTLDGSGQTTGQWDMLNASFFTRCHFDGDFDARVDYTLLTWPQAPGVRVQLSAWFPNNFNTDAARAGNQYGDGYDGDLDHSYRSYPSNDARGTLRVARSGGVLSSYFLEDGKWVLLVSGSAPGPAQIGLQLFAMGTDWAHKTTRAALDNFSIAAQTISCN